MENRDFSLKKRDLLILLAVFLLAAAAWLFWRATASSEQNLAVITLDGAEIRRIDLETEPDGVFSLQQEYGVPVSFEIKEGAIRFVNVDCPDHICEGEGFVSLEGQTAVCMPNRVALSIYGSEG